MSHRPLISICMPVFNAGPYLQQAIEGVLGQTYTRIELVICDNGSKDDSVMIARRFAESDRRVRFIQNTWNIGYAGNAHKAMSLGKGEFLLMHGADDYLMPFALDRYVELIQQAAEPKRLVLMSDFIMGDAQGHPKVRYSLSVNKIQLDELSPDMTKNKRPALCRTSGHFILRQCLPRLETYGGVGSVLVARNLFESVEGYVSNHWFNPDKYFIYKVLSLDPEVVWVRRPLYFYRVHEFNQLSQQQSTGTLKWLLDEYAYTFEFDEAFYGRFGQGRDRLIHFFIDQDCLNSALRELAIGSRRLGFRQLAFALATYPDSAWHNPKTYWALLIWLFGPLGRAASSLVYRKGWWKRWFQREGPLEKAGQ
ncbi:glycosyltransferase family 2 protein [bacterium]|nr:glycosyltransferase family 2 protein [bacterium]